MNNKKPIIGITPDLARNSKKYRYSPFPWHALRRNYSDAIIKAGGIPILLPYQHETIDELLQIIDGVIIPGGGDLHPKFYESEYTDATITFNDARDEFEMLVLKKSLEKNIPILGICRGMQLLNVIFGGTLIKHIPDYIKSLNQNIIINHVQLKLRGKLSHLITIAPNTKLAAITNALNTMVNSIHHQAVKYIGKGLVISAKAEDGIIEAIESPSHNFVIGVQWHPEYLNDNGIDFNLFKKLVDASS